MTNYKFHRVKEIATAIQDVADRTGYDYEFLAERFDEQVEDGDTPEAAFEFVEGVSLEQDW